MDKPSGPPPEESDIPGIYDAPGELPELNGAMARLAAEIKLLRELLEKLRLQSYIQALLNTRRIMLMSFISGIMSGLGTVIGATLVLALLLYILGQLEVVPLIGNFIARIVNIVRQKG